MSSPLHWIRKHQRYLMGIFGVLLILSFTVSLGTGYDPLVEFISGGGIGSSRDPIVVSSTLGKLTEGDLQRMRLNRELIARFQASILQLAASRNAQFRGESALEIGDSDEHLFRLYATVHEARKAGIVITNIDILDFLNTLTDAQLEEHEFDEIWKAVGNRKYSQRQLMEMLRTELMAHRYRDLTFLGVSPVSTVQQWELFNRIERRLSIETFAINVEDYKQDVGKPTDRELMQLFEQHRNEYPDNVDGRPGFKVPRKRAFSYVKFQFPPLLEAEKAKVTDAQIAEYYEANKESFVETSLPSSDLQLDQKEDGASAESSPEAAAQPGASPSDPAGAAEPGPSSDAVPSAESPETNAVETMPPDDSSVDTPEPTAEASDSPAEASDAPTETAPPSEPNPAPTGSEGTDSPAPTPEEPPADTAAEEPKPAPTPLPQESTSSSETPPSDAGTPPVAASSTPTESPTSASGDAGSSETVAPDPSRYKPLDSVREEIRETIAMPLARARLKALMLSVNTELARYHQEMKSWEELRRQKKEQEKPAVPDLSKLSSDLQLKIEEIPLTDAEGIRTHEMGQTYDVRISEQGFSYEFFQILGFRESLSPYQSITFPTYEDDRDRYIVWVTENQEPKVPTFAEAKEAVIAAWTRQQALLMATKAAQEEADKAKQSGEPLEKCCVKEGRVFIPSTDVHWLVSRSLPTNEGMKPALGRIEGMDGVTEAMMRALYRLRPGEIGVIPNGPKTQVYVVRVISEGPDLSIREEIFLREARRSEDLGWLFRNEATDRYFDWYRQLLKKYKVVWHREPRPGSRM